MRDMNLKGSVHKRNNTNINELNRAQLIPMRDNQSQEERCRVCLSTGDDAKNPLINPCACKGDSSLIHFNCLKRWLREKKSTVGKNKGVSSFIWQNFKCEICTHTFPSAFKDQQGQLFQLLDFTEIKKHRKDDFILLESLPLASDPSKDRKLILVKPNEDKKIFTIGRDKKNDIEIAD